MERRVTSYFIICLCMVMMSHTFPAYASDSGGISGTVKGTYMSSTKVYAKVKEENDVIGNAVVTCLSQVAEIDVDMYLQRAYGNVWQNVTGAYNMNVKDAYDLDESAIIYNVAPGTYRVYIEARVTGYDGLWDTVGVGTGSFTINT